MIKPTNAKERGLIKGALRRVFSRSELRREVVKDSLIQHTDLDRPRVTKWSRCSECKKPTPAYLIQIDHIIPLIPIDKSLEEMTWDELIDRLWCDKSNLTPMCQPCHSSKSKAENKLRRKYKNERRKID